MKYWYALLAGLALGMLALQAIDSPDPSEASTPPSPRINAHPHTSPPVVQADSTTIILNAPGYPDLALLCIGGRTVITTDEQHGSQVVPLPDSTRCAR